MHHLTPVRFTFASSSVVEWIQFSSYDLLSSLFPFFPVLSFFLPVILAGMLGLRFPGCKRFFSVCFR